MSTYSPFYGEPPADSIFRELREEFTGVPLEPGSDITDVVMLQICDYATEKLEQVDFSKSADIGARHEIFLALVQRALIDVQSRVDEMRASPRQPGRPKLDALNCRIVRAQVDLERSLGTSISKNAAYGLAAKALGPRGISPDHVKRACDRAEAEGFWVLPYVLSAGDGFFKTMVQIWGPEVARGQLDAAMAITQQYVAARTIVRNFWSDRPANKKPERFRVLRPTGSPSYRERAAWYAAQPPSRQAAS